MSIFALAGAVITAAILSVFLKEYKREYAPLIGLGVTGIVLLVLLPQIKTLLDFIQDIAEQTQGVSDKILPLMKAVGIAICAEIASDICADAGENAMAKKIELAGKTAILILAVPVAQSLLSLITEILK